MGRFSNTFKEELTEALVYPHNIEELYERIASWFYYYNHEQIHTILLMSPAEYAKQLQPTSRAQASLRMDKVPRKMGAWQSILDAEGIADPLPAFNGKELNLYALIDDKWASPDGSKEDFFYVSYYSVE